MRARYGAIVVYPDRRIVDYGNILAIARVEAKKSGLTKNNVDIKSIIFDPLCNVFIALFPIQKSNEDLLHKPSVTRGGKNEV